MLSERKRDECLARLDALADLLAKRLGPKPQGWYNPDGIDDVWEEYASIRRTLIDGDRDLYGRLPECLEPTEDEREACGFARKGIPALRLQTLHGRVVQARTLTLGGSSIDRLDARAAIRLDLWLKRLTVGQRLVLVLIPLLTFLLGLWSGTCAWSPRPHPAQVEGRQEPGRALVASTR